MLANETIAADQLPEHQAVLDKMTELYGELFAHSGYADMRVEMRILKRGQKEIIIHAGKQYRYVVNHQHNGKQ